MSRVACYLGTMKARLRRTGVDLGVNPDHVIDPDGLGARVGPDGYQGASQAGPRDPPTAAIREWRK